jgi:hypothetical protein
MSIEFFERGILLLLWIIIFDREFAATEFHAPSGESFPAWMVDNFLTDSEIENIYGRRGLPEACVRRLSKPCAREYHREMTDVLTSGSFMKLFESVDGYMGLCPRSSLPDDLVCVLCGSRVPVILREVGDHYVHVGTGFVEGLMGGEVRSLVEAGRLEVQMLDLRASGQKMSIYLPHGFWVSRERESSHIVEMRLVRLCLGWHAVRPTCMILVGRVLQRP